MTVKKVLALLSAIVAGLTAGLASLDPTVWHWLS